MDRSEEQAHGIPREKAVMRGLVGTRFWENEPISVALVPARRDQVPGTLARVGRACRILTMGGSCGGSLAIRCKTQVRAPLQSIFAGAALKPIVDECEKLHAVVLKGRVWVALHMHAGDGNVHTNIPVNSDNYEMLQTAHRAVARIMKLARSLDGVISEIGRAHV